MTEQELKNRRNAAREMLKRLGFEPATGLRNPINLSEEAEILHDENWHIGDIHVVIAGIVSPYAYGRIKGIRIKLGGDYCGIRTKLVAFDAEDKVTEYVTAKRDAREAIDNEYKQNKKLLADMTARYPGARIYVNGGRAEVVFIADAGRPPFKTDGSGRVSVSGVDIPESKLPELWKFIEEANK